MKYLFFLVFICVVDVVAQSFENEILEYEKKDKISLPSSSGIVFVGSSTFRRWWALEKDFLPLLVYNRGFGGAEYSDILFYTHRIITNYKPRCVVVYAGDNDLAHSKSVKQIMKDVHHLIWSIHEKTESRIFIISVKPSPQRLDFLPQILELNRSLYDLAMSHPRVNFINTYEEMFNESGQLKKEFFVEDGLHLSEKAYEVWRKLIHASLATHCS